MYSCNSNCNIIQLLQRASTLNTPFSVLPSVRYIATYLPALLPPPQLLAASLGFRQKSWKTWRTWNILRSMTWEGENCEICCLPIESVANDDVVFRRMTYLKPLSIVSKCFIKWSALEIMAAMTINQIPQCNWNLHHLLSVRSCLWHKTILRERNWYKV